MRRIFEVRYTAFEGKWRQESCTQVVGMTRKWTAREKMSAWSGLRGRWRETFSPVLFSCSPFLFVDSITSVPGTGFYGEWLVWLISKRRQVVSCHVNPYRSDSRWSKYICNNDSPSWTPRVFIYCFVNHKMPWKGVYSKLARNWDNMTLWNQQLLTQKLLLPFIFNLSETEYDQLCR